MFKLDSLKKIKKSTIIIVVAVVILAIIVGSFLVQRLMGNPHPMIFNIGFGIMDSTTMGSKLPEKSIMILCKQDQYAVNDIVTYTYNYQGETLSVTNRIIDSIGDVYYLKGDLSQYEDPEVIEEQIVGKVVFHFPSWILIGLLVGLWLSFFATYGAEWLEAKKKKEHKEVPIITPEKTEPSVQLEFVFHPEKQETEINKIVDGKVVETTTETLPPSIEEQKVADAKKLLASLSAKFKD